MVTAEWSPDGRRLLTTTTSPRLNVDNGFKIWRYNGELLYHAERNKLYEATWQPVAAGTYKSRPISPGTVRKEDGSGLKGTGDTSGPRKPPPYVPPHGSSGTGSFSLAHTPPEESKPGKYRTSRSTEPFSFTATSGPPGATFADSKASKNAAKNAKKRAAAKAKKGMGAT